MTIDKWQQTNLGDQVDLLTGFPFKSAEYTEDISEIPLVRGDNVVQGMFRWDDVKRWSRDQVENISEYFLKPGDIVLAMDRPWIEAGLKFACVSNHDIPCLLVQRVSRLRAKDTLEQKFLRYVIGSPEFTNYILGTQTGTAVPHISGNQIKQYQFLLPTTPEQRAIGGILGALDDKIELNRRMNRTLESMARAVFRQWFVENEDTGDWEVGTVGDVVKRISVGKKYDFKTALPEGRIPVLDQAHFSTIGYHNEKPGVVASIDNPVIVFSNHRCYTDIIQFPFSAIQNVLPFVGDGVDTRWLYHATNGIITYSEYKGHYPEFISKPLVIPPEELTNKFGEFVKPLHIKIMKNKEESRTMASLRDSLLPKLMRGEVRVKL